MIPPEEGGERKHLFRGNRDTGSRGERQHEEYKAFSMDDVLMCVKDK